MATSVGRSVAGRMIGRRGVNQSDGRSIGRLVESVRRSVGPTITHCPQLTIRYPYPRYPLVEPLSNTSFSCSYPRSLSFLPSSLPSSLPFFIFLIASSLLLLLFSDAMIYLSSFLPSSLTLSHSLFLPSRRFSLVLSSFPPQFPAFSLSLAGF